MKTVRIVIVFLLAAALLCSCGLPQSAQNSPAPEATPASGEPQSAVGEETVVVVSDIMSFLNALAPNTVIEIDAEYLLLDRAADYGFGYATGAYTWRQMDPGEYMLVIRDLEGLTIRGRGMGQTTLSTASRVADVIRFENCSGLTLEGMTLGHRAEVFGCAGDVLSFEGCDDVVLRGCDLFGCGVTAVSAYLCTRLYLEGCMLRYCSLSAVNVTCCTDFQARDCSILRCGSKSYLAALCVSSCNGFALINCTLRDGENSLLLDAANSPSVCLLGCEATGNSFSEALFRIYDRSVTVSGCALSDNEFGSCYGAGSQAAETASGQALTTFADFARMELKPYTGEYVGPEPFVTPSDIVPSAPEGEPGAPTAPAEEWDGEPTEVHVQTVDELLAAIAPHTVVYLDAEEFDLSTASDYGKGDGEYYVWIDTYDGPELAIHDLDDFTLVGGGMGLTLVSAVPRYADVLYFENCRDISLRDMTLGHRIEPGYCAGDVLELSLCSHVHLESCGLYGCGVTGINANSCYDLHVSGTNIYDCSYLGAQLSYVTDALFTGCSVTNCGEDYGFNGFTLYGCSGVFYDEELVEDGDFHIRDAA